MEPLVETETMLFAPLAVTIEWLSLRLRDLVDELNKRDIALAVEANSVVVRHAIDQFCGLGMTQLVGPDYERKENGATSAIIVYVASRVGLKSDSVLRARMVQLNADNVLVVVRDDNGWSAHWLIEPAQAG